MYISPIVFKIFFAAILIVIIAWRLVRNFDKIFVYPYVKWQMDYMERYIKKRGWYNERIPNFPSGSDYIINPDGFMHPEYKDNGYNSSGVFTLYGAYMTSRGKYINGKKVCGK